MINKEVSAARTLLVALIVLTFTACGSDDPISPVDDGGGGGGPRLSFDNFQAASLVIGQPDMSSGQRNGGSSTPNAMGLAGPRVNPAAGVRLSAGNNPNSLYVADSPNDRVVSYRGIPAANGATADFALGQPDLTSRETRATSASSLSGPTDCVVANRKLFVTERSANRILIWNSLPAADVAADIVVGQLDFTSDDGSAGSDGLFGPRDAEVAGGRLFVADTGNNRVLIWNTVPTTNGQPADVVVGQPDFASRDRGLSAAALASPLAIWTDGSRLAISDSDNHRILLFNTIPAANGAAADLVVGQPDFTSNDTGPATASNLLFPWGVASDGSNLFVADSDHHRVLVFAFPTTNGAAALAVLGQSSFTLGERNDPDQDGVSEDVVSSRTFFTPAGITLIGERLVVTDANNYRLLVFDSTSEDS